MFGLSFFGNAKRMRDGGSNKHEEGSYYFCNLFRK